MMISNNLFGYPLQIATGAQGSNALKATTATTTTNGTTIQLTAKEVSNGVYRWIDAINGAANPKLKVFENANNIIKIQNPTDTKHQLIIDTGADELASKWSSSCQTEMVSCPLIQICQAHLHTIAHFIHL